MAINLPFKLHDQSLFRNDLYVGGAWVEAQSGKRFNVIDPGSDRTFTSCPDNGPDDVESAVLSSNAAFNLYRTFTPRKRSELLLNWHNLIVAAKNDLAQILTHETGKPLSEAHGELDYALGFTWWFAGEAERIQGSISIPAAPNRRVFVIKQPIGVAVALVPWNFPVAMILRKAGAALAAGCTMIVKPSPETPLTCLTLAYLATKAGFPPGAFNVLTTSLENTPSLSESLITHPLTKKVTFTGSTQVVQKGIYKTFVQRVVEKTKELVVGYGADPGTTMGPLTTPRGLEKAATQVQDALEKGAELVLGDGKPHQSATFAEGSGLGNGVGGYFLSPTILTNMTQDMLISQEECFSPLCGIFRFETEEEVTRWANKTSMGLASYAFTKDVNRIWRLFENLEAGMIGLNTGNQSATESPFGGIKESGYGKESGKDVAVQEYLIEKTETLTLQSV
ncbi:hypothetical protein G7046_g5567 [Stylonectria norvegica]|nr:hypothetical protein G7046_g5567 [Stylonectria norvegica]